MDQTTPKEVTLLLRLQGLFSFSMALGGIFLQVFIFTLGGFPAVARFNLAGAVSLLVMYGASGWLMKRFSSRSVLRMGVGSFILLFLLLFILREQSLQIVLALGLLNGIGLGGFWAVVNLLGYVLTPEHMRTRYFGWQGFIFGLTQGVAPVLGGAAISSIGALASKQFGYSVVFFLITIFFIVVYREGRKLPVHSGLDFSLAHMLRHKRRRAWKLVLWQDICYGLFDFSFGAFSAVLIYLIVRHEVLLGTVNAAESIMLALSGLLAGMVLRGFPRVYRVAMFFASAGIVAFAFWPNAVGIVLLVVLYFGAIPFLGVASSRTSFEAIDQARDPWQSKFHFFVEREMALGIGRAASLLLFLWIMSSVGHDPNRAREGMYALAVLPLAIGIIQRRIENELTRKTP